MEPKKCVYGVPREQSTAVLKCKNCPFKERYGDMVVCVEPTIRFVVIEKRLTSNYMEIVAFDVIDTKRFKQLYGSYELEHCTREGHAGDAISQGKWFDAWRLWKQYSPYDNSI